MSGKSINFNDKKINKSNFCKNKKLFNVNDIDANKIFVSEKESYGTKNSLKYFIAYNGDDVIKSLCKILPQMIFMLIILIVMDNLINNNLNLSLSDESDNRNDNESDHESDDESDN